MDYRQAITSVINVNFPSYDLAIIQYNGGTLLLSIKESDRLTWEEPPDHFCLVLVKNPYITQVELPDENDGMKELTRIMSLLGTKRTNGTALGLSKPCPTLLGRMESLSRSSTPLSTLPSSAQIYTP